MRMQSLSRSSLSLLTSPRTYRADNCFMFRRTIAHVAKAHGQHSKSSPVLSLVSSQLLSRHIQKTQPLGFVRALSTAKGDPEGSPANNKNPKPVENVNSAEDALVLTPYEKVAGATRGGIYLGLAALACVCAYFIGAELLSGRMSGSTLLSEALEEFSKHYEVKNRLGEPLKGYGRDHHGQREGRRNFTEHFEYKDTEGRKRFRIRFNVQGPRGKGIAYAEIRDDMKKGEWVYLMVQVMGSNQVIILHDNRGMLNKSDRDAMGSLLNTK